MPNACVYGRGKLQSVDGSLNKEQRENRCCLKFFLYGYLQINFPKTPAKELF